MMDKDRTLTQHDATVGDEFHRGECSRTHGPRGGEQETIRTWRRTGATKLWKTRPEDFRVPVRYGMRNSGHDYITPDNVAEFHLASRCPLADVEYRRVRTDGTVVELSKAGGGTLGRRYTGEWNVAVWDRKGHLALADTLRTAFEKTHAEAANIVLGFLDGDEGR